MSNGPCCGAAPKPFTKPVLPATNWRCRRPQRRDKPSVGPVAALQAGSAPSIGCRIPEDAVCTVVDSSYDGLAVTCVQPPIADETGLSCRRGPDSWLPVICARVRPMFQMRTSSREPFRKVDAVGVSFGVRGSIPASPGRSWNARVARTSSSRRRRRRTMIWTVDPVRSRAT